MLKDGARVAIVYLLWSNEPRAYLERALLAMEKQTYPKELIEFLIIYNSHKPDEPSQCPYIREEVARHSEALPHTTVIEQEKNLGFSGGNNFGMKWAIENSFDYVFLHNGDGYLHEQCLEKLVEAMENDKKIGTAQSLVLLYPETHLINTAGNCSHYLGLGFCNAYRQSAESITQAVKDVGYASGAAIIMRTDLLKQHGLWDEDYFLYHEDLDYSFRLKTLGYRVVLVPQSIFYHEYKFSKSASKYFWMERNRFAVLLMYYKWLTLILLLPMMLALEIGLWLFAIKSGWGRERVNVYQYWLKLSNWKLWLAKRRAIQANRKIPDRELLKTMAATVNFSEKAVESPVLKFIGNPLMSGYFWLLRLIVWW
ncbi:glycosyltransferase family 2 protein [Candidatus Falkowbacteria bacterium]|nr:glycosyltransferase family 2 protein [Candidatus Falkowbacteria bacterium]